MADKSSKKRNAAEFEGEGATCAVGYLSLPFIYVSGKSLVEFGLLLSYVELNCFYFYDFFCFVF